MTHARDDNSQHAASYTDAAAALFHGPRQGNATSDNNVTDEIAAELADHLAEAAAAAKSRGLTEQQAKEHAAGRFGDAAAILRQCWWIKKGDAIMFRSAAIALLSVCVIGLFAVAYSAWRIEASFTDQMGALSGQLAQLNETLSSNNAPAAAVDARPQITGKLYLGDPSKPAVGADVEVWDTKTMQPVRQLRTNEKGEFASGPMPDGEYFLLASLVGEHNPLISSGKGSISNSDQQTIRPKFAVQSRPVTLWRNKENEPLDLDVQFTSGEIVLEFDQPFAGMGIAPITLLANIYQLPSASIPWSRDDSSQSPGWPLRGDLSGPVGKLQPRDVPGEAPAFYFGSHDNEQRVPANRYAVRAMLTPQISNRFNDGGNVSTRITGQSELSFQQRQTLAVSFGRQANDVINLNPYGAFQLFYDIEPIEFEVRPNQLTRLRLVVPDGYEESLNAAVETVLSHRGGRTDLENQKEIVQALRPRPIRVELIGYEPLDNSAD